MKTTLHAFPCLLSFFLLSQQAVSAQAGITWAYKTAATNNTWKGVTYGNGLFVAVANTGTGNRIMTSPDAVTWTSRNCPDSDWNAVTYANGLFVAVGKSAIITSPDGKNWTNRTPPQGFNEMGITYANSLFVAVGGGGIYTSPDGINWTSRTLPAVAVWLSVTYGNGLFVAVSFNVATYSVMTSPDGITWTARVPSTNGPSWNGVTYGNGLFVAVSDMNGIMTSPDGITWTNNINAGGLEMKSVAYGNGLFVAMGIGVAYTSPDGVNWTKRDFPLIDGGLAFNTSLWPGVTFANGLFVGVTGGSASVNDSIYDVITSGTLGALAVHWINFNGTLSTTNNTQLSWKVAEQNVKNYAIEKSYDGAHYSTVATISSKGNGENSYAFTETAILNADAWYRIKQTDADGKINYSSTVHIIAGSQNKIRVFPNPARDAITVTVGNVLLNKTARLTNMDGKLLQTFHINNSSITINLRGYGAGIYLLKVENEMPVRISKQ